MDEVNMLLPQYEAWEKKFDSLLAIGVTDPSIVYLWREQAEHVRRVAGEGALTKEEIKEFCDRFMPSYDLYMQHMLENGIQWVSKERTLTFF